MNLEIIYNELNFKAVRSSGAGGQHVNKVSSKVELLFDIENSKGLSANEKELLIKNLKSRLTKNNHLQLSSSNTRSQHRNKEIVIKLFFELLKKNTIPKKKRKATVPTKASIKKRLKDKKYHALKKAMRKKTI